MFQDISLEHGQQDTAVSVHKARQSVNSRQRLLYQEHGLQPVSVYIRLKASDIQCAGIVAHGFLQCGLLLSGRLSGNCKRPACVFTMKSKTRTKVIR